MSQPSTLLSRLWLIVPLCAIGFLGLNDYVRLQRVQYVNGVGQEMPPLTSVSPTGYAGGTRELIVPEHLPVSYEWVVQTQSMLATGQWRSHEVDYENAPFGRVSHFSAPYRWWLGLVAWVDHLITGRPLGVAVEDAALVADPVFELLWLIVGTFLVSCHFGRLAASLFSIALVTAYPLAAGILPATPDDYGPIHLIALAALLLLLIGLKVASTEECLTSPTPRVVELKARSWFFAAGVAGGIGVWINMAAMVPLLTGIAAGGLVAAWLTRRKTSAKPAEVVSAAPLWRAWAIGGGGTVLLGYLIEYFPYGMEPMEFRVIHPLYGVSWLGAGELLARLSMWIGEGVAPRRLRDIGSSILALAAALSALVADWLSGSPGFLAVDLLSFRLTKQPDAVLAPNLATWLGRDGLSATATATLLVLIAVALSIWFVARRSTPAFARGALAILLTIWALTAGLGYFHLRWWAMLDVVGVAMLVIGSDRLAPKRWVWVAGAAVWLAAGVPQLFPARDTDGKFIVTVPEVDGLIERDLGHWLAKRIGPERRAIVLAPPNITNALHFYGGLRGVSSLAWENKDGLSVALRIMVSNSPEEAHELFRRRGINYVVLPTWEPFFDTYASAASIQTGDLFLNSLRRWAQPSWLRPLPYPMPSIPGFEQQSVLVFEVVDNQGDVLALCRELEYFIETGQAENARAIGQTLKRFPMDLGAAIARAQLEVAMGGGDTTLLDAVLRRLKAGGDRTLAWDMRVSLADLLARARRFDDARVQTQRCLGDATEAHLRELTPSSLFHLLGLAKGFGLQFRDPALHDLALDLLPSDFRSRL